VRWRGRGPLGDTRLLHFSSRPLAPSAALRAAPPPLCGGEDQKCARVLATHLRASAAVGWAKAQRAVPTLHGYGASLHHASVGWAALRLAHPTKSANDEQKEREAERRQTRSPNAPRFWRGGACLHTRPPVGVPPRLLPGVSEHSRPASGHASWDAAATIIPLGGRYSARLRWNDVC
jgi:hypothetical protein